MLAVTCLPSVIPLSDQPVSVFKAVSAAPYSSGSHVWDCVERFPSNLSDRLKLPVARVSEPAQGESLCYGVLDLINL